MITILGEVQRLSHLLHVTEKQASGVEKALEETKRRTQEMTKLNQDVEETIKSIPVSTAKTVTTTTDRRGWRWWFWWGDRRTSTETKTTMVCHCVNPNF